MYCFDQNSRTILEKLSVPLAIYQVIDHQVVTLLVSDGLCLFTKDSRNILPMLLINLCSNVLPQKMSVNY